MNRTRISTTSATFLRENSVASVQNRHNAFFSAQAALPKLPVPELKQTMSKFVRLSKPITSDIEHKEIEKIVEEFLATGEGAKLQSLLQQRAEKLPNWLAPWWLNQAYLEARTPLPICMSPGVLYPKFDFSGADGQISLAAKVISAALQYHDVINSYQIPQDKDGNAPLDMSQYAFLYGTTRIPQEGRDRLRYGFQETTPARHVIIARNGHFFNVPVFNEKGHQLSYSQIVEQIKNSIVPQSEICNPHQLGIVSSNNRDDWARVYQRLKDNNYNAQALEAIETALFVICLDNPTVRGPERTTNEEYAHQMLHGGGSKSNSGNRWFDKTLQFIIGHEGYSGFCFEHTPADGPPVASIMEFVCDHAKSNDFFTKSADAPILPVKRLDFILGNEEKEAIRKASQRIDAAAEDVELKICSFKHFGKNLPKSHKLSPDSFIQMAFQLTYFRMYGKHPPTYETATLRKFREGRTDNIRLPNPESASFVEAMISGGKTDQELVELLRIAVEAHKQYSIDAMNGQAIDRHLLGLKLTALESGLDLPKLFAHTAYKKMQHYNVSTSQVPTKNFIRNCFAPPYPDCYGICYNPLENELHLVVSASFSCPETSAVKFIEELEKSLLDMQSILQRADAKAKL
uniref:Choline/carnitine acyltransferase domain-containing protein n=1 Tax=Plectus sambesii TaxID=2011161 RepID=A0A914V011_9BILA